MLDHDIEYEHKSWARLPFYGEFTYKPLNWEWLEDVFVHHKDKLTSLHLFDALVPTGTMFSRSEYTETFLAAFLCCWLCTFILTAGDASCIHLGTFNITSFMMLDIGYCLLVAILVSSNNGLNRISHSSHPRATFLPIFSMDGWKNNLDTENFGREASSSLGLVNYNGFGRDNFAKDFHWHSSIINYLKETFKMMASYQELTLLIFIHSSFTSYYGDNNCDMEHYCLDPFNRQFGFHKDVLVGLNFNNLPDLETMLC
ncbi:LOW QUALITY PROTEIN: hypothetical protein Cgig2_002942 [Carnegiea gigantea]|uniref:Uncharacterized protein n=1 Tax=Carnegiea gigantea TaxID=171969 RepID=A0A9Q1JP45_9CARY|nr:LOW QUALITY PROTEIN: hypothetical protein Cgig2_002942 [Carnegiea gigantea]